MAMKPKAKAGDGLRAEALIFDAIATRSRRGAPAIAAARTALELRERASRLDKVEDDNKRLKTPLERIHAARISAQSDGSHIAAGKMLKEEEILRKAERDQAAAKREALKTKKAQTSDQAADEIVATIGFLDDQTLDRIIEAIEHRRRAR